MMTVLSTTTTFGAADRTGIDTMAGHGIDLVKNPYKRRLTVRELDQLMAEHKPVGLLAGTEPIDEALMIRHAGQLRVISRVGSGWDNVDREAAKRLGIKVLRSPDALAQPVAELTLGLFIDLARGISLADRRLRTGQWQKPMGCLISGKTVGVVGCGFVGRRVCLLMQGLGCATMAYDPWADPQWHQRHQVELVDSAVELFQKADLVSVHAALTEANRHMIDDDCFQASPTGVLMVNAARGELVDTNALIAALENGKVTGAGLDVFEQEPYSGPLTKMDNVVLTPHIGAYAKESRIQMELEAVDNLLNGLGLKK